jgi:hypothetical protein
MNTFFQTRRRLAGWLGSVDLGPPSGTRASCRRWHGGTQGIRGWDSCCFLDYFLFWCYVYMYLCIYIYVTHTHIIYIYIHIIFYICFDVFWCLLLGFWSRLYSLYSQINVPEWWEPQSIFPDMHPKHGGSLPGLAILLSHFPCFGHPDVCLHHWRSLLKVTCRTVSGLRRCQTMPWPWRH